MNGWLDKLLVCAALIASLGYAVYALGPRDLRRRLAVGVGKTAARAPRTLGIRTAMERLAGAAAAKVPGACGSCDSCGDGQAAGDASPATAVEEIRVPLDKITRRH